MDTAIWEDMEDTEEIAVTADTPWAATEAEVTAE